ncbi:MAG TPA: adenylate/guanylate cyclase domain-containing protein, partial [Anaerolineae bacterium]|nr:adenylate/guanylate cyclase domain-containing protein [Anaerolineae bacterium]
MMQSTGSVQSVPLHAYIPIDRSHALLRGVSLPDRAAGVVMFTDISGFTPLAAALVQELGPLRGAEELTRQLNLVYTSLIDQVHSYHGSVIGFSGDAITCWFDQAAAPTGEQAAGRWAVTCAAAMQEAMQQFTQIPTPGGTLVSLAVKVAVVSGPVRRYVVGAPEHG